MNLPRKPWTREETLLALNLYCRISFGQQHSKNSEVIKLATAINRTPGSVAMKLNNFTSIDPEEHIRGVKGLSGASKLDHRIWNEFYSNHEEIASESERIWVKLVDINKIPTNNDENIYNDTYDNNSSLAAWTGTTENTRTAKARLAQSFFRRAVLASYSARCCISGLPISALLVASHILPWSEYPDQRVNPSNGLCLSCLHDKAFDRGLITFDENFRLLISKSLIDHKGTDSIRDNFLKYEGTKMKLPEKFLPNKDFMTYHRENIFHYI